MIQRKTHSLRVDQSAETLESRELLSASFYGYGAPAPASGGNFVFSDGGGYKNKYGGGAVVFQQGSRGFGGNGNFLMSQGGGYKNKYGGGAVVFQQGSPGFGGGGNFAFSQGGGSKYGGGAVIFQQG